MKSMFLNYGRSSLQQNINGSFCVWKNSPFHAAFHKHIRLATTNRPGKSIQGTRRRPYQKPLVLEHKNKSPFNVALYAWTE